MKSVLVFILLITLGSSAFAQEEEVRVTVSNEKGLSFKEATIAVYRLPDTVLITKRLSVGPVTFTLPAQPTYLLEVTAVGYQPYYRTFHPGTDTALPVTLVRKIGSLGNVTVVARKALVKQEDDKTIVEAEPLANASSNAYEVLEKTPGAIVDQDGNVYLNSATPATIFINGREVKLSAADLASLLKSLPANSVQKVEILRNPSAKYDAASTGGIVNIVLKKGVKLGLNGSVNLAHFQGTYSTSTGGFNLNNNKNKTNTYLSYQFTKRNNFESLNSDRAIGTDSSFVRQQSYTTYPGANHYVSFGLDQEVNKQWSWGYDGRISANQNKSFATNLINALKDQGQDTLGQTNSFANNRGPSVYWGNTFYSKYKIDTLGSEWSSSLDVNLFNSRTNQEYGTDVIFPVNRLVNGDGQTTVNKWSFQLQSDLVYKLKHKYTLESGIKWNLASSRNNADYFLTENGVRISDSFQTSRFRYTENIAALYVQVSKTFGKFTVKPGGRLEYTNIVGKQLFPGDTSFRLNRVDFFPYIYLRHPIMKLFGFQLVGNLIARRSIVRPYYEALNPYRRYIDPLLFDVGNPALQPQFTNNYEFNIMADQFPVFSVGLNDMKNIFTNVTYQDPVSKIVYRTFDNLGKNREFYLRAVGGIPPGGKYFFYMGAQHNLNQYTGYYAGQPLSYTRGSWVLFMYHNYRPVPTFNISVNGFMRLRGIQNFYELEPFGGLFVSFNKSILKKKANLILSVNDVLYTNKVDFAIQQPGISASGSRVNDTRRVGLTFRYNFGIKPKEDKKVNFDAPSESNP